MVSAMKTIGVLTVFAASIALLQPPTLQQRTSRRFLILSCKAYFPSIDLSENIVSQRSISQTTLQLLFLSKPSISPRKSTKMRVTCYIRISDMPSLLLATSALISPQHYTQWMVTFPCWPIAKRILVIKLFHIGWRTL
jgi:hypothetical protein